ncbi:MAG: DMT family transporter [Patescibacteria group bacterium]|jgi:drug/metabolite transporter (DMT)-like permease
MWWILVALFSPLLYGAANIVDEFVANRRLKSLSAFLFYSSTFNLLVLPFVLLWSPPVLPSPFLCGIIVLLGLLNFLYVYPYYRSLQEVDTSVVASLFSLSNIFIPIFSYLLVAERLGAWQYAGFVVIILASTLLTFNLKKFRVDGVLPLMLFSSAMVTAESIGFKYLFEHGVSWGTAFGGQLFFSFLFVLPLLFFPVVRHGIRASWGMFHRSVPLFALEELLTFGGAVASTYAMSLAPLTLEKTVEAFQPFFVLILALVFSRWFPRLFKEHTDRKNLMKKMFFFIIMGFGIWLMAS